MAGKVTTLLDANDNTIQLYPRTKTSAVSDDDGNSLGNIAVYNGQTLASGVNDIKIASKLIAIDGTNVLASDVQLTGGYTIPYDECFIIADLFAQNGRGGSWTYLYVDGNLVCSAYEYADAGQFSCVIPAIKNQVISTNNTGTCHISKIFGVKR